LNRILILVRKVYEGHGYSVFTGNNLTMKRQKKNSTPERLLLGLAMGLAGSLCALEYGRPLIEQHKYLGAIEESISYMEDLPPLTFPKPKQQMEPEIVKSKPNTTEFAILEEPIEYLDDRKDLPEFDFDNLDLNQVENGDAPGIDLVLPFFKIEKHPEYKDLSVFLGRNLRFPKRMKAQGMEGTVGVEFIIGTDGMIRHESIKILGSPHPDFSREVIRVMKLMPAWTPGEQRGKKVAVMHRLPINFKLE